MTKDQCVKQTLIVRSLEKTGTFAQDHDVGVIRVSAGLLRKLGGRNALVRVTAHHEDASDMSLIRVLRAATGKTALHLNEIALQYDDRRSLGVMRAGAEQMVSIKPIGAWKGLPGFLMSHTSPLVRLQAFFAIILMLVGTAVGLLIGGLIGGLFS